MVKLHIERPRGASTGTCAIKLCYHRRKTTVRSISGISKRYFSWRSPTKNRDRCVILYQSRVIKPLCRLAGGAGCRRSRPSRRGGDAGGMRVEFLQQGVQGGQQVVRAHRLVPGPPEPAGAPAHRQHQILPPVPDLETLHTLTPRRPHTRRVVPWNPTRISSAKPTPSSSITPAAVSSLASTPFSRRLARRGRPVHARGAAPWVPSAAGRGSCRRRPRCRSRGTSPPPSPGCPPPSGSARWRPPLPPAPAARARATAAARHRPCGAPAPPPAVPIPSDPALHRAVVHADHLPQSPPRISHKACSRGLTSPSRSALLCGKIRRERYNAVPSAPVSAESPNPAARPAWSRLGLQLAFRLSRVVQPAMALCSSRSSRLARC